MIHNLEDLLKLPAEVERLRAAHPVRIEERGGRFLFWMNKEAFRKISDALESVSRITYQPLCDEGWMNLSLDGFRFQFIAVLDKEHAK